MSRWERDAKKQNILKGSFYLTLIMLWLSCWSLHPRESQKRSGCPQKRTPVQDTPVKPVKKRTHMSTPQLYLCFCRGFYPRTHLGMVIHLVLAFWVVMAFSSSSSCPVFFSFFTRLLTAFSHHFSSWLFCSPFFHPKSLFTMGGVKGKIDIVNF